MKRRIMKIGHRTRSRSRIAVMGLGLLAAGAVAVPALAGPTEEIDSRVTLAIDGADCTAPRGGCFALAFHGRVEASKHACEVQRKVKVFSGRHGDHELVGMDRSNSRGKWKVLQRPPWPGWYHAKVVRREMEGTGGTTFVCRGDRTKVIDFH